MRKIWLILIIPFCLCFLAALFIISIPFINPLKPAAHGDFPQSVAWDFRAAERITAAPACDESSIYLRSKSYLYALNVQDGLLQWTADSSHPSDSVQSLPPLISDEVIVVAGRHGKVSVLDRASGSKLWESPAVSVHSNVSSMVISNQSLFIARENNYLSAHRLDTGQTIWSVPVPAHYSDLFLAGTENAVYMAAESTVFGYNAATGDIIVKRDLNQLIDSFIISEGKLYLTLSESAAAVLQLAPETLDIEWRVASKPLGYPSLEALAAGGGKVYASGTGFVVIDATDGKVITYKEIAEFLETPIIVRNDLYVRDWEYKLFRLDHSTVEIKGYLTVQKNSPMTGDPDRGPALCGNLLIVPFGNQLVIAYDVTK